MSDGALAGVIIAAVAAGAILLAICSGVILFFVMFGRELPIDFTKGSGSKLMGGSMDVYLTYVRKQSAALKARPHRPIEIVSARGYKLKGYFFPAENSTKTALCMHGYRSTAFADFAAIAQAYLRKGYNVMLINHEAHGESEGKFIGFGVRDRDNTALWCNAINELVPNGEIILHGISMGAATCLTSSELELNGVKAVVADCGFSSPKAEFEAVRRSVVPFLLAFPMIPVAEVITKLFLKFDFHTVTAEKSVANSRYPLLILHGGNDNFVPTEMAYKIYAAAAEPKEMRIFDGVTHAISHMKAPEAYEETLFAFLDRYVGKGEEDGI